MSLKAQLQTWSDALDAYEVRLGAFHAEETYGSTHHLNNRLKILISVSNSSTCVCSCESKAPLPRADPSRSLQSIADESKILFNIGIVQATIGSHQAAVENFGAAIRLDAYLSVAYFQSGVSKFLLERYQESRRDFDDAYSVRSRRE